MFLRDIDRLLREHDRSWRLGMFTVFALAALQSIAVVARPLPIRALIEPPAPDSFFGVIERVASAVMSRVWLYVGLLILIQVSILALPYTPHANTPTLT